jgi:hypothetical protein
MSFGSVGPFSDDGITYGHGHIKREHAGQGNHCSQGWVCSTCAKQPSNDLRTHSGPTGELCLGQSKRLTLPI